ncbi:MAG: SNF2-related protein, partial [Acidobacteriota bacterium]
MDPFLLDAEHLQALASPPIVRRGIAYFKEDRVVDLTWDHEHIRASVEGSQPAAYEVEIGRDEDDELWIDCQCPFDWEPACKHAIAVLLAYGARQPIPAAKLEGAADSAVDARMRRGRSEVEVRHVGGDRWMGTWEAWSLGTDAARRSVWTVELRAVGERLNTCTCPDFLTNRLGTCKHIEAVLHHLRKRAPKTFERHARSGPTTSLVHLDWATTPGPRIRLRRSVGGGPAWLDEHFTTDGLLVGEPSVAFDALRQAARAHGDVVLADEVERHVERAAEEAERRSRADQLAATIRSGQVEGVDATLYPYQVDGVAFLATAGRAVLADDMGLGKTLQAITAAVAMRRHDGVERSLVICPASLKHQWAREIERFTGLDTAVVQGGPPARQALYRRRAAFTMVNYELVLRDREVIQTELAPDLLILDEAQRIKNWRTKTAAAVKAIDTPYAFVLTGTPLENRLEDLYSLMQVVDARVLGPLWRYLIDFHVTDERGRVLGYRNLAELRRRLAPVMLRRDKSLVRDQLPERLYHRLDVELDRRQRELHEEALHKAGRLAQIANQRPLTPREERWLLSNLQSARMACNAAGLVDKTTEGSPKLDELSVLLEQACVDGGQKVVIFSEWERMTHMAEMRARELGLGTVRLHGGIPTARRGALIDRFRDDPSVQVFVSTDAGGVGLNLQV